MAVSFGDSVRRYGNRLLSIAALVVLAVGVAIVWTRVVHTLTTSETKRPLIGRPQSVVWNNHVFTTEAQLRAYLTASGVSYGRWIALHPGAAAIFGRKPVVHRAPAVKQVTNPAKDQPAAPERSASGAGSRNEGGLDLPWSTILLDLLIALGVLIGASALIPPAVAPPVVARLYAVPERRVLASAAAVSILCGLAVSHMLS